MQVWLLSIGGGLRASATAQIAGDAMIAAPLYMLWLIYKGPWR
jgi:hypothetical protein